MSLFVPLKRATLLIPSGPSGDVDRRHLFILLTDPYPDETEKSAVLLVSISTVRPNVPHDPTCILYSGDHDFVKRDSYVVYQRARLEEADKLLRGVKAVSSLRMCPWMVLYLLASARVWKNRD